MSVEAVISTQVIDTTSVGRSLMTAADAAAARTAADAQVTLVSGTNIKTVNSTSLLGSGDIAIAASPGGSTTQFQYNNAGEFGGATAVVYAGTGTHVVITAQAAATIPLRINGAASQSGNYFECRDSSNTLRTAVNATGALLLGATTQCTVGPVDASNDVISSTKTRLNLSATTEITAYAQAIYFTDYSYGNYWVRLSKSSLTSSIAEMTSSQAVTTMRWTVGNNSFDNHVGGTVEFIAGNALSTATTYKTGGIALVSGGDGGGTDGIGGQTTIRSGRGRGAGTNQVVIRTSAVAASGTTLQTYRDVVEFDENTTSGETPMLLLDLAAGSLKRVSIGASDSGGTGYKVLRVPN